jgi:hexokinase
VLTFDYRDDSPDLQTACNIFQQHHPLPSPPSASDMQYVRQMTKCVTHRATALLATAIHALWCLRASSERVSPAAMERVTIGCNGSVIERYPRFRAFSQRYLNQLTGMSGAAPDSVVLEVADESAIFGAAVAVGCLEGL